MHLESLISDSVFNGLVKIFNQLQQKINGTKYYCNEWEKFQLCAFPNLSAQTCSSVAIGDFKFKPELIAWESVHHWSTFLKVKTPAIQDFNTFVKLQKLREMILVSSHP
jgi:hypothetical protein